MPGGRIPNSRVVIDKEKGFTKVPIKKTVTRDRIFDSNRQSSTVNAKRREKRYLSSPHQRYGLPKSITRKKYKYMKKKMLMRTGGLTQREKDIKYKRGFKFMKTVGGNFKFKRLEKMVQWKHSEHMHRRAHKARTLNKKNLFWIKRNLKGCNILLIVRICTGTNLPRAIRDKLSKIRLHSQWKMILIRNTPELPKYLLEIEPYISYGIPSRGLLEDLVIKKAKLADRSKRGDEAVPRSITSNELVERELGQFGIICVADMVQILAAALNADTEWIEEDAYVELQDGSQLDKWEQFEAVTNLINPIQLNWQRMAMKGMKSPFRTCGYWGNRGTFVSKFVEKLI